MSEIVDHLRTATTALSDRATRSDFAIGDLGHLAAEMVEAGKAPKLRNLELTLPRLGDLRSLVRADPERAQMAAFPVSPS